MPTPGDTCKVQFRYASRENGEWDAGPIHCRTCAPAHSHSIYFLYARHLTPPPPTDLSTAHPLRERGARIRP
jgi:hypothetical protein